MTGSASWCGVFFFKPQARGYDAGKKVVGRKRHNAVDTDARLLMVNLTTAGISTAPGCRRYSTPSVSGEASLRRRRLRPTET